MAQHIVPDDAQGSVRFPAYATLYDLVAREVEVLTDEQLDFCSDPRLYPITAICSKMICSENP